MIEDVTRLPDVVIGGAPRSGTTFLCEVLARHPGAYVARPFIPEPKVLMTDHPAGDAGFRERYRVLFASAPAGSVKIEKTSYYFENDDARTRFARILPEARMVFILREPVSRAYSNWLWSRRNGLETLDFATAIAAEGTRASPLPPDRMYARPFDYLERARYADFAAAWIDAIGRDRVAFHVFEDAVARPEEFVASLQKFARLDALPWSALETGVVNANEMAAPDIEQSLADRLRERLAPEMLRFATITGADIGRWGY